MAGENVTLSCRFKLSSDYLLTKLQIHWHVFRDHAGSVVHSYYDSADQLQDQDVEFRGRTQLFLKELGQGVAALNLSRVQPSDSGDYRCIIINSQDVLIGNVILHVKGRRGVVSRGCCYLMLQVQLELGHGWLVLGTKLWAVGFGKVQGTFQGPPLGELGLVRSSWGWCLVAGIQSPRQSPMWFYLRLVFCPSAPYHPPEIKILSHAGGEVILQCMSSGGYPAAQICWYDGKGNQLNQLEPILLQRDEKGTFQVQSHLPARGHQNNVVCCFLLHSALSQNLSVCETVPGKRRMNKYSLGQRKATQCLTWLSQHFG